MSTQFPRRIGLLRHRPEKGAGAKRRKRVAGFVCAGERRMEITMDQGRRRLDRARETLEIRDSRPHSDAVPINTRLSGGYSIFRGLKVASGTRQDHDQGFPSISPAAIMNAALIHPRCFLLAFVLARAATDSRRVHRNWHPVRLARSRCAGFDLIPSRVNWEDWKSSRARLFGLPLSPAWIHRVRYAP